MAVDTLRPSPPSSGLEGTGTASRVPLADRIRAVRLTGRLAAGLVLALTLISLALRTGQLHFNYWIDEAISVGISSHPLGQLPSLLRQDGSPPLYYLLLHVWMQLFGHGEVATHVLSLMFALLTVPVAYWGGASLFGRRVGIYAAVLAAGLPFLTAYAQETRMYSLLALLSLVAAVSFTHVFVYRRRGYLPLFSLSLAAALYTHNWALFFGVAAFIGFLVCARSAPAPRRPLWRDGAIGFGAVAVLYLPWLPTLVYQAQHTGAPWALPPVVWSLSEGMYFLTGGRGAAVGLLLAAGSGFVALRGAGDGAAVSGDAGDRDAGDGHAEDGHAGDGDRSTRRAAIGLAILGFGTLLIAWGYAKTTPAWSDRYLAVIVGPLIVLFALGLARARGLGVAALALVCCFWVLDPKATSLDTKSNVAAVAYAMRPHVGPDTLVLSTQPEEVPALSYYLPKVTAFVSPLGRVPDPRVMDWRNALARFEHSSVRSVLAPAVGSLTAGQRVLLVIPTSFQKAPMWLRLIHRDSRTWLHYLEHDRRLRLIKVASPHQYRANIAVSGALFQVTRR